MQVYEAEKLDNLSDALKSVSVAMVCPITSTQLLSGDSEIAGITLASISDRPVQADLYYLNSILVSAGWNKNDDVFDVADLWAARETPVDKPFNYMHDETDIIGHMISSAAMGEDGAIINEVPLPDKMDLVTSAVIYKTWGDPDQSIRVNDLIAKIDEGQLAVSMECVFRNFDYAVVEPDGSQKVIARDENSAFLTKHLRAYGGTGSYEGYKIGRLLRDLYFSGKGLVDKPANPRSVILPKEVNPFKPVDTFSTLAMEVVMPEDNSVQLAEVNALKEALSTEKATASTLATEVSGHKATITSLETKVNELEATIATISQEKLTLSQEIQKMVSEVKAAARKNALVTAGATEDKATELLSKFADATDEMFDVVVALIVKPTPVTDTESVEVEVETETEALETVTEVDEPAVVVVEDSVADKISVASQWLRASVLQSTKNSK
jgi:hypothetical protein